MEGCQAVLLREQGQLFAHRFLQVRAVVEHRPDGFDKDLVTHLPLVALGTRGRPTKRLVLPVTTRRNTARSRSVSAPAGDEAMCAD